MYASKDELTEKLKEIIEAINKISSSIGNKSLYDACKSINLQKADELSGMMWLIGRSYAASPQRRSYGLSKRLVDKVVVNKQNKETQRARPVWLVRTENSGNGDFFLKLAEYIIDWAPEDASNNLIESITYSYLIDSINKIKNRKYKLVDITKLEEQLKSKELSEDIKLLAESIKVVSRFNRLVKRGTEKFDNVPLDHAHKIRNEDGLIRLKDEIKENDTIDYVYCKNQVSFASKFLHFFCCDSVFIIDQFSKQGGGFFFDNKSEKTYQISNGLVEREDATETIDEESSVNVEDFTAEDRQNILYTQKYLNIRDELFKSLLTELKEECSYDKREIIDLRTTRNLLNKSRNTSVKETDWFMYDYILHCANSYVLCLYMKNELEITPEVSFPRLSDTVFMRIKENRKETSSADDVYYQ